MVQLPDGRRRSVLRSITDLEMEHSPAGRDSSEQSLRVGVRTLLPLVRLLAARSPSQEGTDDDGADRPCSSVQPEAAAELAYDNEATTSDVAKPVACRSGHTGLDAGGDGATCRGGRRRGAR